MIGTNPARIEKAIVAGDANALLLKVNQIGTLSEAMTAMRLARDAGWMVTVSARSGETEDEWLADLAVGWGGCQDRFDHPVRTAFNRSLAKVKRMPSWTKKQDQGSVICLLDGLEPHTAQTQVLCLTHSRNTFAGGLKYNRLLEIESETRWSLDAWPCQKAIR